MFIFFFLVYLSASERGAHLKPTVQHGVGAVMSAQGLLLLQLYGVLSVEPEEVDELGCSVDLGLDDGLTLKKQRLSSRFYNGSQVINVPGWLTPFSLFTLSQV